MGPNYVICIEGSRWVSAVLKTGIATTEYRHEALRIKDANIAFAILNMVENKDAFVEEINEVVLRIDR
jgi:hypothetical protein